MKNQEDKNFVAKIWHTLQSIFFNGLLFLLPITITVALFTFTLRLLRSWLEPIQQWQPDFLTTVPYSEVIVVLTIIFGTGFLIKFFFLEPLIHYLESLFFKLPLIQPIYGGIKQLVQAFTVQDKFAFQHVVLIEFPRKGSYSIGFLTSQLPAAVSPTQDQKYFNIFIPTTPNPTSGYLVQVAESEMKIIDLTRQEAMSLIISGGIIQPDRFK